MGINTGSRVGKDSKIDTKPNNINVVQPEHNQRCLVFDELSYMWVFARYDETEEIFFYQGVLHWHKSYFKTNPIVWWKYEPPIP